MKEYPILKDLNGYLENKGYSITKERNKKKNSFVVSQNKIKVFKSSNPEDILLLFYFLFIQETYRVFGIIKYSEDRIIIQEQKMRTPMKHSIFFDAHFYNLVKKADEEKVEYPAYKRKKDYKDKETPKGLLTVPIEVDLENLEIIDFLEVMRDNNSINYRGKVIITNS